MCKMINICNKQIIKWSKKNPENKLSKGQHRSRNASTNNIQIKDKTGRQTT